MSLRSEIKKYHRETHPPPVMPVPASLVFFKRCGLSLLALCGSVTLCIASELYMYDSAGGRWIWLAGLAGALIAVLWFIRVSGMRAALARFMLVHVALDVALFIFIFSGSTWMGRNFPGGIYVAPAFAGCAFLLQLGFLAGALIRKRKRTGLLTESWHLVIPVFYGVLLFAGILYSLFMIWFIHSMSHLDIGPVFFKWDC